jgi:gluconokinase
MTGEVADEGPGAASRGPVGAPRHVVVMGVSGCGKTTVAQGISRVTRMAFGEADDFHPEANVAKMRAGQPLADADRWPWLEALAAWMVDERDRGRSTVIACSALRRAYRDVLRTGLPTVDFIHLDGPAAVIRERMATREGHYMPASLLDSQLATLERLEPDESGVVLDLTATPEELVAQAVAWLQQ